MIPLQYGKGWPERRFSSEDGEGFYTAIAVSIGFTIADSRLAQQVNRPSFPMFPKFGQPRDRLLDRRSRNKGAPHMFHLASDRFAAEPGAQACGGHGFEPPVGAEEGGVSLAQIFASQTDHLLVVCNRGQHIDESKELCFKMAILHGQIESLVRPPAPLKKRRSSAARETGELFSDTADRRFEGGWGCRHRHLPGSEKEGHRQYTPCTFY